MSTDQWPDEIMTLEQLESGYGHHHPGFQEEAAKAFGGRR
jgi:hypothetical protein